MASEDGRIDLHIHTTASDGSLSPLEILQEAEKAQLAVISITDHDTVEGTREALAYGMPPGMRFVPGIEISAGIPSPFPSGGTLHILGYFIDPDNPQLDKALQILKDARADRNPKIIRRLQSMGVDITMDEVQRVSGGGQTGRPHIAQVLVDKGVVSGTREAFDLYLAKDQPAYVGKYRLPAREAVELISGAGGLAVCAHPFSLEMPPDTLADFLAQLKEWGLEGLEVLYPQHGPDLVARYGALAKKLNLLVTGGTDFHGASKPDIRLGVGKGDLRVPLALHAKLSARREEKFLSAAVGAPWPPEGVALLEDRLRHVFKDRTLLYQALCHSSFANENPGLGFPHNERLEFLGDAVLNLVVSRLLMEKFQSTREGELSRTRAMLVNEIRLSEIAREIDLGACILLGRGEDQAQGREKNSILSDCLEAVIAAVYLDGDFSKAFETVRILFDPVIPETPLNVISEDYKTRLQESAQARLRITPTYEMVREFGPDHEKTFVVRVFVREDLTAEGQGRSKKAAEQDAARAALALLET